MTYCKLLLCSALLLNFYFFAFSLNVFLSFTWLMMFHKWAILSAWVCYLTQLRVFSDALWIHCTVCIEYSPIYLNYLKPWTCVYLRYTSGTALRDTRTVGRYTYARVSYRNWRIARPHCSAIWSQGAHLSLGSSVWQWTIWLFSDWTRCWIAQCWYSNP